MLADILQTAFVTDDGIEIRHFDRGTKVLEFVENHPQMIDLYILDIRVRGSVNGLAVAKQLRANAIDRPIIISSAFEKPEESVLEALNCHWLAKPWYLRDTKKLILSLLGE